MRTARLGCLTGTGIIAALITAFAVAGYAFASGGTMFSPGALNAVQGQILGGVSSHAEIAGACSTCHVAPWEKASMSDRCVVCHTDITAQMGDVLTEHGRMYKIDPTVECKDCHPEHKGSDAILTVLDGWRYPHELSGFMLTAHQFKAKKDPFVCADCHAGNVTIFDVNVCSSCHRQRDAAFMTAHAAAYGTSCIDCHDGVDRFGKHFAHDQFAFKLTGKHLGVACENCHANAHSVTDFKNISQDCASCHAKDDPHNGTLGNDCASCHSPDDWHTVHFDHNLSVFKLLPAHISVSCSSCHVNNVFKGTPMDCFSCHRQDDPHMGLLGQKCESCHRATTWKDITFNHNQSAFHLIGQHAGLPCTSCHNDLLFKGTPMDCVSCHKDPHAGQMGSNCTDCHNPGSWQDVHFDHSRTGFPLQGSHSGVACVNCHTNGYKGTPSNCYSCHAAKDAHNGQFGTDCASCHQPTSWQDVQFDHGITGFPLVGSHSKAACTSCHVNNTFKGTSTNCYACHANKDHHNGQFGTDCGSCHKPTSWSDVTFNHNSTGFPLTGSHSKAVCTACHVNNTYKGTPMNCYACHASKDHHNGQFGTDCGSCHKTTSWSDVTFNHNSTGFALIGRHSGVQCKACHINGYAGTPTSCYACHASNDNHNGQFGTDCGSCHTPKGWGGATFDHARTGFPLDGKHGGLNCTSCHRNGSYGGLSPSCVTCHEDKHNGQNGTDCAACHNTRSWDN